MSWTSIFSNADFLGFLAAVGGVALAALKGTQWYRTLADSTFKKALDCLESGIGLSYETYVKALKEASADGKLTPDEEARARQLAIDAAVAFGSSQGIDIVKILGREYLGKWLEALLAKMKRTPAMPTEVAEVMP